MKCGNRGTPLFLRLVAIGDEDIESEETSSTWQIQMQTKTKATAKSDKPKQNEVVLNTIRLEGPINDGPSL